VTRFLARDEVIEIVRRIASPPTAPYHEFAVLEAIRGELEAARIAGTVGGRRRTEIESAADEKGIRVLNRREEE